MKNKMLTAALVFLLAAVCLPACGKEQNLVSEEDLVDTEPVSEQEPDSDTNEPDTEETAELYYNEEYSAYIEIDEDCKIYAYTWISGEEYDYAVFGISPTETDEERYNRYSNILYFETLVLKDNAIITVLRDDSYGGIYSDDFEQLVVEEDVNFDGKNDILILQGHEGTQGLVRYTCYLQNESGFELCPSFAKIGNPSVNSEDEVILGFYRNWAASHSWVMYYYIDGEFVEKEMLTEEPANQSYSSEEDILWGWTIKELIDGEWVITEYFTEEDYDDDYIYQYMVYGADSHWDLSLDKWESLYGR